MWRHVSPFYIWQCDNGNDDDNDNEYDELEREISPCQEEEAELVRRGSVP